MKNVVVATLLIAVVAFMVSILCYVMFGWFAFFFHDVLGWHEPDEDSEQWFDGASYRARCRHCGADIMQDSQGNWF